MSNQTNSLGYADISAALLLSACHQEGIHLHITHLSVSPEPIVGQIVTLEVEIMSTHDEVDVIFIMDTLVEHRNRLHLVSGEPEWAGSLAANQPQTFQFSVCVQEEGSWPIELTAVSRMPDAYDNIWHAFEIIHLESSKDSGRLIRGKDFTMGEQLAIAQEETNLPFGTETLS
jgi:hypothetical protein